MWQVRETGCQGHGRDEVQPPATNLSLYGSTIVSTLLTRPGGKSWPSLTRKKEKIFPNGWVKPQDGNDGKDGAEVISNLNEGVTSALSMALWPSCIQLSS